MSSDRRVRERVEDILEAIASVQTYVAGMTLEQFRADRKTVRAAAYEIGVIGEAVGRLPVDLRAGRPALPWAKMQGMRNVVVHEYFRVDPEILWHTITEDLPPLIPLLQQMLREL